MVQTCVETKVGVMNISRYQYEILRLLLDDSTNFYYDEEIRELVDDGYIVLLQRIPDEFIKFYHMSITLKGLWLLFLHRKGLL
jgi:hypothetical protein